MQALFIRHAESTNNVILKVSSSSGSQEYQSLRSSDPDLSEWGYEQVL